MAAPELLKYQTWLLKVPLHCEGCRKKVKKVLQSIDGVYKIEIDSQQQKVTVTGNVEADTLIKRLLRSGKHAELWPQKTQNKPEKPKDKDSNKKQNDQPRAAEKKAAQKPEKPADDAEKAPETPPDAAEVAAGKKGGDAEQGGDQKNGATGGGKKKKKGQSGSGGSPANGEPAGGVKKDEPAAPASQAPAPEAHHGAPHLAPVNPTPAQVMYPFPPIHSPQSIPAPPYGVSYSVAQPSVTTAHFAPPMYGYSNPAYAPLPPPSAAIEEPGSYGYRGYDDDQGGCSIM